MSEDLERVAEAYRAPQEDDDDDDAAVAEGPPAFFVVSVAKLIILDVLTMSFYSLYWFYKHWQQLRRTQGLRVNPLARAFFSIFYVHRLFRYIDHGAADQAGVPAAWNANSHATLFIVLSLAGALLGRVGGAGVGMLIISSAIGIATVLPLAAAQKQANLASGDAEGRSNSRFHAGSVIALILGSLAWAGYLYTLVIANQVYIPPDP
jgi:hypothetical protein